MRERRTLNRSNLRELCIRKNWFTCGTNEEYEYLLKWVDAYCDYTTSTADIVFIATNILEHSCLDYWKDYEGNPIKNICFEISRICYSIFEQEDDHEKTSN